MTQDTQNFADEEELNQPQTIKEKVRKKSDEPKEIAAKEKTLKQQHNVNAQKMTPSKKTASKSKAKTSKAPKDSVDVIGDDDRSEAFMAAIGYIPPLFIIPLLARKESEFAQFHAKQAMAMFIVLMIFLVIWWVVIGNIPIKGGSPLWWLNFSLKLGFVIIFCIGLVTAFQGKKTKIPPFSLIAQEIKV